MSLSVNKRMVEEEWNEEEQEWYRIHENQRTCAMRRICATAVAFVYAFFIFSWRMAERRVSTFR